MKSSKSTSSTIASRISAGKSLLGRLDVAHIEATAGIGKRRKDGIPSDIPARVKPLWPQQASEYVGPEVGDWKPILYLSGCGGSEMRLIKEAGMRYRCLSYTYCGFGSIHQSQANSRAIEQCLLNGVRIFLDSGAHSFHNILMRGKGIGKGLSKANRHREAGKLVQAHMASYSRFVRWCYANSRYFDWYATLDAFKDCPWIYDITKEFETKHHIRPVPVYHGDSSLDWVQRYIDEGHKIIGVSHTKFNRSSKTALWRYFNRVVDHCYKQGVQTHGFAVTGQMMFDMPWTSVDSATYLQAAKNGKILEIDPDKRQAQVHITGRFTSSVAYGNRFGLLRSVRREMRDTVERRGFDFDLLTRSDGVGSTERMLYNAKVMNEAVEKHTSARRDYKRWDNILRAIG